MGNKRPLLEQALLQNIYHVLEHAFLAFESENFLQNSILASQLDLTDVLKRKLAELFILNYLERALYLTLGFG